MRRLLLVSLVLAASALGCKSRRDSTQLRSDDAALPAEGSVPAGPEKKDDVLAALGALAGEIDGALDASGVPEAPSLGLAEGDAGTTGAVTTAAQLQQQIAQASSSLERLRELGDDSSERVRLEALVIQLQAQVGKPAQQTALQTGGAPTQQQVTQVVQAQQQVEKKAEETAAQKAKKANDALIAEQKRKLDAEITEIRRLATVLADEVKYSGGERCDIRWYTSPHKTGQNAGSVWDADTRDSNYDWATSVKDFFEKTVDWYAGKSGNETIAAYSGFSVETFADSNGWLKATVPDACKTGLASEKASTQLMTVDQWNKTRTYYFWLPCRNCTGSGYWAYVGRSPLRTAELTARTPDPSKRSSVFAGGANCVALASGNDVSCKGDSVQQADCKGILLLDPYKCYGKDCKTIAQSRSRKVSSYWGCDSEDCKAMIANDPMGCESRDCVAFIAQDSKICN